MLTEQQIAALPEHWRALVPGPDEPERLTMNRGTLTHLFSALAESNEALRVACQWVDFVEEEARAEARRRLGDTLPEQLQP